MLYHSSWARHTWVPTRLCKSPQSSASLGTSNLWVSVHGFVIEMGCVLWQPHELDGCLFNASKHQLLKVCPDSDLAGQSRQAAQVCTSLHKSAQAVSSRVKPCQAVSSRAKPSTSLIKPCLAVSSRTSRTSRIQAVTACIWPTWLVELRIDFHSCKPKIFVKYSPASR